MAFPLPILKRFPRQRSATRSPINRSGSVPRTSTPTMRAASSTELPLLSLARMRLGACLGRTVCRHPIDMLGLLVLAGAGLLILGNALYMQAGAHPSPMRSPVSQVRAVPQLAVVARPDQTGSFAPLPKPAVEPSATQTIAAD